MAEFDRRSLLRRAGVVGAVVWAAPVVQSLGSPAWAVGSEAPEEVGDGSPGAISYVVLVLACPTPTGTRYFTAKFEANGSGYTMTCPASVSKDDKGCAQLLATYTQGLVLSPGCPTGLTGFSKQGDLVVQLGSCTVQHYIVHDGSLKIAPKVGGGCRGDTAYTRTSGTLIPALTAVPGWTAPAVGTSGRVVFHKP